MRREIKIIGLAGTNGSGKDTVGELLAKYHGYLFVSVSDMLREECRKRGLPVERENLRTISAEWRREFGLGVLVDKAVEKFNAEPGKYTGVVASPMRNTGETQHLKDLGGTVIWVDADPKIRYQRIFSRQRTAEDNKTYDQFLAEERDEMYAPKGSDAAVLNLAAVKDLADIFMDNNSSSTEVLHKDLQRSIG
jgi:dephospho-CoA kinase